jgi:hypothetical protein
VYVDETWFVISIKWQNCVVSLKPLLWWRNPVSQMLRCGSCRLLGEWSCHHKQLPCRINWKTVPGNQEHSTRHLNRDTLSRQGNAVCNGVFRKCRITQFHYPLLEICLSLLENNLWLTPSNVTLTFIIRGVVIPCHVKIRNIQNHCVWELCSPL